MTSKTPYIHALDFLRNAGYLVIAWTPEELEGLSNQDISRIADVCTERGNDMIYEFSPLVNASIQRGMLTTECGTTLDLVKLQATLVREFQAGGNNALGEFAHKLAEVTGKAITP